MAALSKTENTMSRFRLPCANTSRQCILPEILKYCSSSTTFWETEYGDLQCPKHLHLTKGLVTLLDKEEYQQYGGSPQIYG
ncbi:hypothetical protein CEXT_213731 [Caerostris extrusa]|uniref:Uncharacterized protein n=1 Tax=Caerostris extrusa TaxID=172846 RepID=A0AAV4X7Q0_CAEEX|nr:hypothetical protein CEXT_213731 [Caerostris extrusa]